MLLMLFVSVSQYAAIVLADCAECLFTVDPSMLPPMLACLNICRVEKYIYWCTEE